MFNPNDFSSYASSSQTNPHLQYSHPSSSSTSSHQAQHPTSPSFLNQPPPSSSHALTPPTPQPQQQQRPSNSPSGSTGKTVKGKGKMKVKEEGEGGRLDAGSQPTKKRKRGRMATACVVSDLVEIYSLRKQKLIPGSSVSTGLQHSETEGELDLSLPSTFLPPFDLPFRSLEERSLPPLSLAPYRLADNRFSALSSFLLSAISARPLEPLSTPIDPDLLDLPSFPPI